MVLWDSEGVGGREEICANAGVTRKAQQSPVSLEFIPVNPPRPALW